ncbi:MAG TPA: uroporphyrinogen-III synthase [Bryobacteraceae bacterium]|nr:uroporphyrinogen-III synthase [Bryobacteraceae bacterium]
MPFDGLRVLSLESRRCTEIERLVRTQGGVCFVAPSMREVPLCDNPSVFQFAARLFHPEAPAGGFDMVVFLTGVGAQLLNRIVETRFPPGSLAQALRAVAVVVRGSKPLAVMREWSVPVTVSVPEPNTWREVLSATEGRRERNIAVQEYGRPVPELIEGFRRRGAQVTAVPVYQWDLPTDLGPLKEAARRVAAGEFDVILLTTSMQMPHFLRVAASEGLAEQVRRALGRMVVASVGPSTTETLRDLEIPPDLEPSHPKMGFLVNETAARAREIRQSKLHN